MTPDEITEGLRLDAARTPGPWAAHRIERLGYDDWGTIRAGDGRLVCDADPDARYALSNCGKPEWQSPIPENGAFICHAANHYGAALRELAATKDLLDEALSVLHNAIDTGEFQRLYEPIPGERNPWPELIQEMCRIREAAAAKENIP